MKKLILLFLLVPAFCYADPADPPPDYKNLTICNCDINEPISTSMTVYCDYGFDNATLKTFPNANKNKESLKNAHEGRLLVQVVEQGNKRFFFFESVDVMDHNTNRPRKR